MTAPVDFVPDENGVMPNDIQRIRGKNYPEPGSKPQKIVDYVNQLWGDGEADALLRYRQATHNILFANDRQHLDWSSKKKGWVDLPEVKDELRVTANYVKPMLRARVARLASSEINWNVSVRGDNSSEAHDRATVGKMVLEARWSSVDLEHRVRTALLNLAFTTGCFALKWFWNPNIGPIKSASMIFDTPVVDPMTGEMIGAEQEERFVDEEGNPVETEAEAYKYRPGDVDVAERTIFNIRLNPEARGWTSAEGFRWLIDSEVVALSVAKEKYPDIADKIKAQQGTESAANYEKIAMGSNIRQESHGVWATLPQSGKNQHTAIPEVTVIREYWEDRSLFFPRGRLVITVGEELAYDGEWPQGVFPYIPFFDEPGTMAPYGRPAVNSMVSPQKVLNDELSSIAQEMKASGTGQFVAFAYPGIDDQITSQSRAIVKIPVKHSAMGRSVTDFFTRIPNATVSPDRWRLVEQAINVLQDIGGYHEVSRGQIPPGLDSGVAIERLLESESMQLKEAVESLKRSYINSARALLAIARWGYGETEERWIPASRPDLGVMLEKVTGSMLPDPDELDIDIEYFRPQSEAAVRAEVKEFMGMGVLDPRKGMKIMDLGKGFEQAFESQSRHYIKARRENLAIERGEYLEVVNPETGVPECVDPAGFPFLLPLDDDHLIHIEQHHEILLDPTKPPEIRQKILAHINGHRQAAIAMAPPAPAPPPDEGGGDGGSDESKGGSSEG